MTYETIFNDAKRRGSHAFVKTQISAWLRIEDMPKEEVGQCVIFTFNEEFFVVNKVTNFYKSYDNKEDAFNYCLDNINGIGQQTEIL